MKHCLSIIVAAMLVSTGPALAQQAEQPPAKKSAPAESSHAPGHDVQTGTPETGEKEQNDLQNQQESSKKDKQNKMTAPPK